MKKQKTLFMLIGVPGVGKSFWVNSQQFDANNTVMLSTDNFIDAYAAERGLTYNDVFKEAIGPATAALSLSLDYAIKNNKDIVWDQTNVSTKTRMSKLAKIPESYRKVAVFFKTPEKAEHQRRLATRKGKTIPRNILMLMIRELEIPQPSEGFDQVIFVET